MSENITTDELEKALEKLASDMGLSIKEYLTQTRPIDTKPAKDCLRTRLGLKPRDS